MSATYHESLGGEVKHVSDVCCISGERKTIPEDMSERVWQRASFGGWPCCVTAAAQLKGDAAACVRVLLESCVP